MWMRNAGGMCVGDGSVMDVLVRIHIHIHIHISQIGNWQLATGDDKNAIISNTNIKIKLETILVVNSRFVIN